MVMDGSTIADTTGSHATMGTVGWVQSSSHPDRCTGEPSSPGCNVPSVPGAILSHFVEFSHNIPNGQWLSRWGLRIQVETLSFCILMNFWLELMKLWMNYKFLWLEISKVILDVTA
jgi:hypothetical protein